MNRTEPTTARHDAERYWCERAEEFLLSVVDETGTEQDCLAILNAVGLPFTLEQVNELVDELTTARRILADPDAWFYAVADDMGQHTNVGPHERFDFAHDQASDREGYVAGVVRSVVARRQPWGAL